MTTPDGFAGTELWPIDDLQPHPDNPNEGDVGAIMTMIATDGWHGSVLCQAPKGRRKRPRIVAGHTRWAALRALQDDGLTIDLGDGERLWPYAELAGRVELPPAGQVPVELRSLSDLVAARKLVSDNQASRLATTDEAALAAVLQRLREEDRLLGTGFDDDDLSDLVGRLRDLDAAPIPPDEFPDVTELATEHRCPSCGYEWSGSSRAGAQPAADNDE